MLRRTPPRHPRLELDYVYNEIQGPNELAEVTIGVSLSGGGYRATLFAAGAIAALTDAGLWSQVRWVASVSGGSFANAAAALELSSSPQRADVDAFLRSVALRCERRGSLVGAPVRTRGMRGPAVVARAYQAGIDRHWLGLHRGAPRRLVDLQRDDRVHAFLAVDLATLQPVFLSDRLVHSLGLIDEAHVAHEPGDLPLATAMRASASFPLLPAVRVRATDLGTPHYPLYEDLFLGDGGVWNNLGTHWEAQMSWLRRDLFGFPAAVPRAVDIHVVVDSSAPARRPKIWRTSWWPLTLDRPILSLDRALHAAFQSTLEANRRALRDAGGSIPRRIIHVAMDDIPRDVQVLSVLVGGADPDDWRAVSSFNSSIGTALPTMLGVDRASAVHLMAHGYAQMAAGLTVRGVPFQLFEHPHPRIESALR